MNSYARHFSTKDVFYQQFDVAKTQQGLEHTEESLQHFLRPDKIKNERGEAEEDEQNKKRRSR